MPDWTIQNARDTYNIEHWSEGYFNINEGGHLTVCPAGPQGKTSLDLFELVNNLRTSGLALPVLVRFGNILHDRVDRLCDAFGRAIAERDYQGRYTAIYPIKVNQQRSVVSEIIGHGGDRVGLESGSKPELMAVLAMSRQDGGIIVCNGYKDREYIRLALLGCQLGHRVFIVVEKLSEIALIIEESRKLNIAPLLGVRVRLSSIGAGKWQNTGGEKSKFGLSAEQTLQVIEKLRAAGMLDSLQLLHFHLGSQIANIRDIQRGMRECSRYYAELRRQQAPIQYVDVGGGLGIDYEGTRSRSFCSTNYSIRAYADQVVQALWEICNEQDIPHPHIFTESGRAMTAHHAVLITNVIDAEHSKPTDPVEPGADDPIILHDLWQGLIDLNSGARPPLEAFHDAAHWLSELHVMYNLGVINIEQKAHAEQLYTTTCHRVRERLSAGTRVHREVIDELNEKLADKYFCNLSIFQSLPDIWAIDQIFPIMPLHRLDEAPLRRATLQDVTCDSDGRIDQYVDSAGLESTLPLHAYEPERDYLLGIFLIGAYQEILGDMHNLFGDTAAVNVMLDEQGGIRLLEPEHGDTVSDLLRYVHFDPEDLRRRYREKVEQASLDPARREMILAELEAGLSGYTYLED